MSAEGLQLEPIPENEKPKASTDLKSDAAAHLGLTEGASGDKETLNLTEEPPEEIYNIEFVNSLTRDVFIKTTKETRLTNEQAAILKNELTEKYNELKALGKDDDTMREALTDHLEQWLMKLS